MPFKLQWFVVLVLIAFTSIRVTSSQLTLKEGRPQVKCESGIYLGTVENTRGNETYYYQFLGLRYANPPDRFKASTLYVGDFGDLNRRPNVHHAIKTGSPCSQAVGNKVIGEEDCLFLNVHIPMRSWPPQDGFPVMLWIHGGAFGFGSGGLYEPEYFMEEPNNVILITINYRLGALGFLSTADDVIPGNMGLKDVITGLHWVQRNIKHFGGDPKRVTIFGESAGAAMVHYLLLSPLSKGLFHNAIAQSGSTHNFWAFNPSPSERATELGQLLECNTENSETLGECLMEKSVEEIVYAQSLMKKWHVDPFAPFSPSVEQHSESEALFLPDYPSAIIERREFVKVPIMLGFTKDEGFALHSVGIIKNETLTNEINTDFETIAPITFNFKEWFPSKHLKQISQDLRKYYFGDKPINQASLQNLTNLYSDANFVYGIWKFALGHATENPVYPYVLTFQDEENSMSMTKLFANTNEKFGVTHGDDIQYLFKSAIFGVEVSLPRGSEAENFSRRIVKLWSSFATHRKPTELWGSAKEWQPISKAQLDGDKPVLWYQLDRDTKHLENLYLDRKKFWDKIFKRYSQTNIVKDEL